MGSGEGKGKEGAEGAERIRKEVGGLDLDIVQRLRVPSYATVGNSFRYLPCIIDLAVST